MKLTSTQIENLYKFTRQHYVVHYDLQTELVDHMANAIEKQWEQNPKLAFETARDQSFKTFGVFGFMDVVEKRQKAMGKRYIKLLWQFIKEWLSFPKLVKTLVLFSVCFFMFSLVIGKHIAITAFIVLFLVMFFKGFKFSKYIKKKENSSEKLWLLEDLIFRNALVNALLLLNLLFQSYNVLNNFWSLKYSALIAAAVFTFAAIYTYVSIIVLPQNAEKLLKKTYTEYAM